MKLKVQSDGYLPPTFCGTKRKYHGLTGNGSSHVSLVSNRKK